MLSTFFPTADQGFLDSPKIPFNCSWESWLCTTSNVGFEKRLSTVSTKPTFLGVAKMPGIFIRIDAAEFPQSLFSMPLLCAVVCLLCCVVNIFCFAPESGEIPSALALSKSHLSSRVSVLTDPDPFVDLELERISIGSNFRGYTGVNIYRTCSLGDFNGDGLDDLMLISVFPLSAEHNVDGAYVLFGQDGAAPLSYTSLYTWEPSETAGFRIVGSGQLEEFYGDGGGDYNNDGFPDILLTRPYHSSYSGITYVIYGGDMLQRNFTDIDLSIFVSGPLGYRIHGGPGDRSGQSVANAGDVNSDDYDDIILCSPGYTESGEDPSCVCYVLFGQDALLRTEDIFLRNFTFSQSTGFKVWGSINGPSFATSVSGNFDFNNDSYTDVLIGHSFGTPLGGERTAAYIIFGHESSFSFDSIDIATFESNASVGVRILSDIASEQAWHEVYGVGDVNNDGIDDVMVEVTTALTAVLFGTTDASDIDLNGFETGSKGFLVTNSFEAYPSGDINDDGIPDLLFSLQGVEDTTTNIAIVFFGKESSAPVVDVNLLAFSSGLDGVRIIAKGSVVCLGSPGGPAGDFNGDGLADIVLIAYTDITFEQTDVYILSILDWEMGPSAAPTDVPTLTPSRKPTSKPTTAPKPTTKPSTIKPSTVKPTTYHPSLSPSTNPSVNPSVNPSANPTVAPTSDPALVFLQTSPSYKVRNGFAFCAYTISNDMFAWGEEPYGGALTTEQATAMEGVVVTVVASRFAYAARTADAYMHGWGAIAAPPSDVHIQTGSLVANEASFAALTANYGVVAFGSDVNGGNVSNSARCSGYVTQLASGVSSITATAGAFAALKTNGEVYAWGNVHAGGGTSTLTLPALNAVSEVFATRTAFAALLSSGGVVTWGDSYGGGDSTSVAENLSSGVVHIVACRNAFVAVKANGAAVVWGHPDFGGNASSVANELSSGVAFVASTFTAIAALKQDNTVVTWGKAAYGGNSSSVQAQLQNVVHIAGNARAFAALTDSGAVVAWGHPSYGGEIPADKVADLSSDVVAIYHTDRAFAALKENGELVVWGAAGHGGSPGVEIEAMLLSSVHTVCSNDVAFSAIKNDGTVIAWGHPISVPVPGVISGPNSALSTGVTCA